VASRIKRYLPGSKNEILLKDLIRELRRLNDTAHQLSAELTACHWQLNQSPPAAFYMMAAIAVISVLVSVARLAYLSITKKEQFPLDR